MSITHWQTVPEGDVLVKTISVVEALKQELALLIVGKETGSFPCDCGKTHYFVAAAAKIVFPEEGFGNEADRLWWGVQMQPVSGDENEWSYLTPLTTFLPEHHVSAMFSRHFGDKAIV